MVGIEYDTEFLILKKCIAKYKGQKRVIRKTNSYFSSVVIQCSVGLDLLIDMTWKEHECCNQVFM